MEGIKIEVTGNIARVIEKPSRITSGTVGLPVEFIFDSQWDGLGKMAVFRAGHLVKTVDNPEVGITVPWEVLMKPKVWLSVGVYGVNADGSVAIPTIWANVCVINVGVKPDCDHSTVPPKPDIIGNNPFAVLFIKQVLTDKQKAQARKNIGIEDAVLDILLEINLIPAIADADGSILSESDGTILLNL